MSDYSGFDFEGTWRGRQRTIDVERRLVFEALGPEPGKRVLEIGVGFGRLTPSVASASEEYVGVDLDSRSLGALAGKGAAASSRGGSKLLVEANAFHLPFVDSTFDAVVLVRIYHHFRDPGPVLEEVHRCLAPGGRLLLQYNPKPTVGTLTMDVRRSFDARRPRGPWVTFAPQESVGAEGGRFPVVVSDRSATLRHLRSAGFEPRAEWGTLPERLQRWTPLEAQLRLGRLCPQAPWFPSRFLVARRPLGAGPPGAPVDFFLACPRCRDRIESAPDAGPWESTCRRCAFRVWSDGTIVHARYAPAIPEGPSPGSIA